MKKFIVIYHAPAETREQMMNVPAEEQAKGMELWMQWAQKTGGNLVDLGAPLMGGVELEANGATTSPDDTTCGYSIVQADSLDAAKALFEGHPHLGGWNPGATIEVFETVQLPGM